MRAYYAIQVCCDEVMVTKIKAKDVNEAYDAVDYNYGSTIILRANEAAKVAREFKELRGRNVIQV